MFAVKYKTMTTMNLSPLHQHDYIADAEGMYD